MTTPQEDRTAGVLQKIEREFKASVQMISHQNHQEAANNRKNTQKIERQKID